MKKATPWAEDIEKAIAKAYNKGREDERAAVAKQMTEVYEFASKIMQRTAGYQPPKAGDHPYPVAGLDNAALAEQGHRIINAPKRKAVTASTYDIAAALIVLQNTEPPYSALSPKNVAAVWYEDGHDHQGAYKVAGAALKALVADGRAVVKRGKYAQAQPTVDNGLSQTPALSGQS